MSKDCTIQDVFHRFYSSFESTHSISPAQRKAAYHIMNCKTGAFGVNVSICEDCGCISVHYNSCRDRCCPMCQEFPKEKWVDARREDILDAPYFHVVFTVPEELNPIIYSNQKFLYAALYHAASDTLSELAADSKYLNLLILFACSGFSPSAPQELLCRNSEWHPYNDRVASPAYLLHAPQLYHPICKMQTP